jgi:integrase
MPSGSAVIRYQGKRAVSWRIKYRDATGRQVMETLGTSPEWNRRKAQAALRARLAAVEGEERWTRPERTTFEGYALEWLDTYPGAKGLKASTTTGYGIIVRAHLAPYFGNEEVSAIDPAMVERYIATKRKTLSGRTVNRHLNILGLILRSARRDKLTRSNPVSEVDRPRETDPEWRILTPTEVRRVEAAFRELIEEAEDKFEQRWRETCRVIFLTVSEVGLRRAEVRGLRWRWVALADPEGASLRVAETFVQGGTDTPKSKAGRRTLPISSKLAAELFDHRARSPFQADDDLVFVSAYKGSPIDPRVYAETFRAALSRAGITDYLRPFHDGRHSAITNAARAGRREHALMTLAGHSDSRTTRLYTHLAGEMFRDEADRMGAALWGEVENLGRNSDPGETQEVTASA